MLGGLRESQPQLTSSNIFFLNYEAETTVTTVRCLLTEEGFCLLQVSAPLSLSGAGFTLHALTDSKRLFCVRDALHASRGAQVLSLKEFSCYGGNMCGRVKTQRF